MVNGGRFLMWSNEPPDICTIFAGFAIGEVELKYSITGGGGTKTRELLICSLCLLSSSGLSSSI